MKLVSSSIDLFYVVKRHGIIILTFTTGTRALTSGNTVAPPAITSFN
jgi:hypothetical protein